MLMLPLLFSLALPPSAPAPVADRKEVRKQFVELAEKQDREALVALWKANPGFVLPTIDADLKGSLSEQEKSAKPDMAKVKKMHERALFGAECAVAATGHPILLDYASSFVGWNAAQKRQFRDGQKVCGAAEKALEAKDFPTAQSKARECVERASALGDWWGTAMGYDALARAYQAQAGLDDALTALSQARLLNHDLGLLGEELQELASMADLCVAGERWPRGAATAALGAKLAKQLGDAEGEKKFSETEKKCREKLAAAK